MGIHLVAPRLLVVASVELLLLVFLARCFGGRRRDLTVLALATLLLLIARRPHVPLMGYDDYQFYLRARGLPINDEPVNFLQHWVLRTSPRLATVFHLTALLAASLPPLTYLVAITKGGSHRQGMAAGLLVLSSASLLAYGPGIDTMMILASGGVAAALLAEAHVVVPAAQPLWRWGALALCAALSALVALSRAEGGFLLLLIPLSLAIDTRLTRPRRLGAVVAWLTAIAVSRATVSGTSWNTTAFDLAAKVRSYLDLVFTWSFTFLLVNALGLGVALFVYRRWRLGRSAPPDWPLLLPLAAYAAMYASSSDRARHQLVLLPLLVPEAVLGLALLKAARPPVARAAAVAGGAWYFAFAAVVVVGLSVQSKQTEFNVLRTSVGPGSTVYYLPYHAFDLLSQAPLMAVLDASVQIHPLRPPPGCPPSLFEFLAALHHHCAADDAQLDRCQRALARSAPDWVRQARILADAIELSPRFLARLGHETITDGPGLSGERSAPSPPHAPRTLFFIPYWAASRAAEATSLQDTQAEDFPEFRFYGAAALALELPAGWFDRRDTLTAAVPVSPAEGGSRCRALATREDGAALFRRIEAARLRREAVSTAGIGMRRPEP